MPPSTTSPRTTSLRNTASCLGVDPPLNRCCHRANPGAPRSATLGIPWEVVSRLRPGGSGPDSPCCDSPTSSRAPTRPASTTFSSPSSAAVGQGRASTASTCPGTEPAQSPPSAASQTSYATGDLGELPRHRHDHARVGRRDRRLPQNPYLT